MKRIEQLFHLHRARSDIFGRYEPGDVPYVGNGLGDNAVVGLVKPLADDRVFEFPGIAVSAFCEATVQVPPFVACGRAGNGLVVLQPRKRMPIAAMAYYAAYINLAVRWRFSWYWQTTADRLRRLEVPDRAPAGIKFSVRAALPAMNTPTTAAVKLKCRPFALGELFQLEAGDYHSVGHLPAGTVPVVSCGDGENGVCGYFKVDRHLYRNKLTIAFNGMNTLTAKYHPYEFAAKDDVAVCTPRKPMKLTTQLLIQVMLGREQWRYSYYRKCFKEKLERVTVPLPATASGEVDEDAIEDVIRTTPYAGFLTGALNSSRADVQ